MDPEICASNFAAMAESSFKYGEMIMEAVSTINGGNGVDIDRIANYIKERYEEPEKFRKHLRDKLKKLVSGNKLGKVENGYRIIDGAAETPKDSTKQQDLPTSSMELLDGAVTTTEDSFISVNITGEPFYDFVNRSVQRNPGDKLEQLERRYGAFTTNPEDQQRVPNTELQKFIDFSTELIKWTEYSEYRARQKSHRADVLDKIIEHSHTNLLLAEEIHQQCRRRKYIPLVEFTEDIFEDWLVDVSAYIAITKPT